MVRTLKFDYKKNYQMYSNYFQDSTFYKLKLLKVIILCIGLSIFSLWEFDLG